VPADRRRDAAKASSVVPTASLVEKMPYSRLRLNQCLQYDTFTNAPFNEIGLVFEAGFD